MMKYNEIAFNSAVQDYKNKIRDAKGKGFFIVFDISNREAFYSIAPLSRALHEIGADVSCLGMYRDSESYNALMAVYDSYLKIKSGLDDEVTNALMGFIDEVDKKAKGDFERIFSGPDFFLEARKDNFEGSLELPFHAEWFKEYRMNELLQTAEILWKDVYALKKGERAGIGFTLIPTKDLIGHPLEDYLDSYSIIWAMTQTAKKVAEPIMNAYTFINSML